MSKLNNESILVTGGAGFIGSFLTERLADLDADVTVADDFSRGCIDNIAHLDDEITLVPIDLTTRGGCLRAIENTDYVFHRT